MCTAQLTVSPGQPAATLASTLAGPGVTILNPVLTCPTVANGTFTSTGTLLTMGNGIVLTNGHSAACAGPEGALVSFTDGTAGDPSMAALLPAGTGTYDACVLEFDIVAAGDSIGFNYQFGSEEYRNAVCSIYTDLFAFFISGPGITGAPNIALVPGTTIPVEINSINNGTPGYVGGATLSNCTSLGPGSPFTSYYIDNTGGTQMSYRGYTQKLRAVHAVTACDTYHLKLAIVDAGNAQFDSGVFLEGGSLTTNSYSFSHLDSVGATIDGLSHTVVRGCSSTNIKVVAAHTTATATTLNLTIGGTAVNGTDIVTIPTTVVLPADSLSAIINIQPINAVPGGPKTLILYLNGVCGILDSVLINIIDAPTLSIITPDTSVCAGQSFTINTLGTPAGLNYSWSPAAGLGSTSVMSPICTPTATGEYVVTATLPNSGCAALIDSMHVTLSPPLVVTATSEVKPCNSAIQLFSTPDDNLYLYSWLGPNGFTSTGMNTIVANPVAADAGAYTVTVTDALTGCQGQATTIATLPPSPGLELTHVSADVTINVGGSVQLNADTAVYFWWMPDDGTISNRNINNPVVTPTVTTTYTVYAMDSAGCRDTAEVTVTVVYDSIMIPTAFTPNGDGRNDIFRPVNMKNVKLLEFSIYNRWGERIYTTSDKNGGWDGTYNGARQDMGVYYYMLVASLDDGASTRTYSGNFTLLR